MSMLSRASDSLNNFSVALYSKLVTSKPQENLFYSPASIYVAMTMTYAGTKGNTAKEIEQAFNWNNPEIVNEMTHSLQESILSTSEECSDVKLILANRLWTQEGYAILKEYIDILHTYYKAEMGTVNFKNQTEEARGSINQWVEDKTNNKIKDLIMDDALTSLTRLVLTNAVYFKGFWKDQFKNEYTRSYKFIVSKTKRVKIKMMMTYNTYLYGRNEQLSCEILKLPYKEKKMAMMIFLPDEVDGLFKLENQINAEHIRKCEEMMRNEKVHVSLPKFKLDCQFNLNEIFSQLGICDLFDIDNADLSGITGTRELFVFHAVHQAFVNVDEDGTEAAAATGVVTKERSLTRYFTAAHPFLFVIQHCESGAILFQGRVVNPK